MKNEVKEILTQCKPFLIYPTKSDNLIVANDKISLDVNNLHNTVQFNLDKINRNAQKARRPNIIYPVKNIEEFCKYSPLEYDKNQNNELWTNTNYNNRKIRVPSFQGVFLVLTYAYQRIPTGWELMQGYMYSFTHAVDKKEGMIPKLFKDGEAHLLEGVNCNIIIDGNYYPNHLLKFNVHVDMPTQYISTAQLMNRLDKVYPSLVRDLYSPLIFASLGANAKYDYWEDLNGIDMRINGYAVRAFSNTASAKKFAQAKEENRHIALQHVEKGIILLTDIHSRGLAINCLTKDRAAEILAELPNVKEKWQIFRY